MPFSQAPESIAPNQKTFRTFLQWKAEAQAVTADYQRNGYLSPLAWVLPICLFSFLRDLPMIKVYVEGHSIPQNAIIGGVDRKGPWHIARVFYEVRF